MNRKISSLPFFLALMAILVFACKKTAILHDPQLPAVTETGNNTFGALINNITYIPYYPCKHGFFTGPSTPALDANFYPVSDSNGIMHGYNFSVDVRYKRLVTSYLTIRVRTPVLYVAQHGIEGTGNIIDSLDITYYPSYPDFGPFVRNYDSTESAKDRFTITKYDPANQVISGNFAFTLYNYANGSPQDTARFTEGRFDFSMNGYVHCDD